MARPASPGAGPVAAPAAMACVPAATGTPGRHQARSGGWRESSRVGKVPRSTGAALPIVGESHPGVPILSWSLLRTTFRLLGARLRARKREMRSTDVQETRVVVVGQGYVGLPLAVAAAGSGFSVVGIDREPARVILLNDGHSPIGDVSDGALQDAITGGRYRATTSFDAAASAGVIVLCVPTPYHNQAPDLSHIESAARAVARHLSPGTLVVLESTTYPGTTVEVLCPLLEEGSGMVAGQDFDLAFSPERVDPGNPVFGLNNTPKIVGGLTPEATDRAAWFYERFVERVVTVSSPDAAEMAKLLENTFRHINIALVNELAVLCQDLSIDIWEVIDAAASKPFGFMPFYPGPGVGGHCIPVDPMYFSWRVRQFGGAAKFIELARDINNAMPLYCVARIQDLLNDNAKPLKASRILVVGVTYKANIADTRESPALPLISALIRKGCKVSFADPYVDTIELPDGMRLDSVALEEAMNDHIDCSVIVTPHSVFDLSGLATASDIVFDTRNTFQARERNVFRL
jgi:UDP-N-acetyl-D-glucosamine dehydrogenase